MTNARIFLTLLTGMLLMAAHAQDLAPTINPPRVTPLAAPAPAAPEAVPSQPAPAATPAAPVVPEAPALRTQLSSRTIAPGQQAVFSIIVDGTLSEQPSATIQVSGLDINFSGTATRQESVQGRISTFREIRYLIEGLESGDFTIPAQTLIIEGVPRKSESINLSVRDGEEIEEGLKPQVQLSVGKTEMWRGEVVPVNVTVLVHQAVQPATQFFPQLKSDSVAVARFDRPGSIDMNEIGGEVWRAWRFPSALSAIKAGVLVVGPAELKADVIMPLNGALRDPFGGVSGARRAISLKSNTININVKELPELEKPKDFLGAVGQFSLQVRTNQQGSSKEVMPLGDPIAFEMIVTGSGNFDALTSPILENATGFRLYPPRVSQENRGWGTEPGQKVYSQILFPEKPGTQLVSWTLHFFDPVTGKYVSQKSQPIELIVTGSAAEVAAESNATAAESRDFSGTSEAAIPDEDLQDILPQTVGGGRLFPLMAFTPAVSPAVLHGVPAAFLAFLLSYGGVRRYTKWRNANAPATNAPRALAAIMPDLRRCESSYGQFYRAVSEYIHSWEYHNRRPLPSLDVFTPILIARDRWLYAATAESATHSVPDTERATTLRALETLSKGIS